ncbi:MAG: conjugal transfer protein TrbI [Candidatus Margulisbacteria bacterium]|nr:conjugal transfer protein TrbI [Candidatus Margulisiibacteriota bacterium]
MNTEKNLYIETSPEKLSSEIQIKRLNKVPVLIVIVLVMVLIVCMFYVLQKRRAKTVRTPSQEISQIMASDSNLSKIIQDQPEGLISAIDDVSPDITPTRSALMHSFSKSPPRTDEWKKVRDLKLQMMKEALYADTKSQKDTSQSYASPQNTPFSMQGIPNPMSGALQQLKASVLNQDPNKQDRKEEFLSQVKSTSYLPHTRIAPRSPYEIKSGTVLPATMISGINSDLPGQLIAQVSQHIYDTAMGHFILIPQGSKLIGYYDSHVAFGQKRVLIAWHRLIFPDASTLELGAMPGSDQSGYAGFNDKVNTHFWKIFGNAFLLSVMSAGFQMSQPENTDSQNPQSQISASMGQQFSQLGMEMAKKNMVVQPTLEIRPGYRFNVMVNKDILFNEPYNH